MGEPAILALENGCIFRGSSIGYSGHSVGEVVFNTAMTGYQEILTDPSYSKQIVTLTYPHIGNVGVNDEDRESNQVHASGLVIRELSLIASNWRVTQTLPDYLRSQRVVAIAEIDTRRLTRILREQGAQRGCIMAGEINEERAVALAKGFSGLENLDLAKEVTTSKAYTWTEGSWQHESSKHTPPDLSHHVVVYDYGVKLNILRMLVDQGCKLTVVPAQAPAETVLKMRPDAVFLSNGPGDPAACDYAVKAIQTFLEAQMPLFGICLGHQLLALASGARTHKMKFGHHGANHPIQDLATGQVWISSQNHGFAVADKGLPSVLEVTHRSLFDGSIQGIRRIDKPAFSFQGHPEASPGPHDVGYLFKQFLQMFTHVPEVSASSQKKSDLCQNELI